MQRCHHPQFLPSSMVEGQCLCCKNSRNNELHGQSGCIYIYPSGSSRSSNRDHPRSWSWKTTRPQSCAVVMERIGSWWTSRNVSARIRSSQFGEPDRDDIVRSRPNRRLDRNKPIGTYVIVSEREIRPWLILTPEIDKSLLDRIRAQQIVSERIDSHHLVFKSKISEKIPRLATNG